MGFIDVPAAMKRAEELLEQKDKLQEQIANVRDALRGAIVDGDTTEEQALWIESEFPKQKTKTPEERVAAAEARLKDTQDKAAKAAEKNGGSKARTRQKAAA